MNPWKETLQRLRHFGRRAQFESEMELEVRFHIDARTEELQFQGLAPERARGQAEREFGNRSQVREDSREAWEFVFLEQLLQDVSYALRTLRANPRFTLAAILILAVGIGASVAMFSVVNTVVLRPLEYRDPDRIMTLATWWKKDGTTGPVSVPDFQDWHDQSKSFSAMAYYQTAPAAISVGSDPEFASVSRISPEFLSVFAVQPFAGRTFSAEELKAGPGGAALVGASFWKNHFGDAYAPGRMVRLAGQSVPVIGVLPAGFRAPGKTDIWVPTDTTAAPAQSRSGHNVFAVGRLKPDVTPRAAQTELVLIADRLARDYPLTNGSKNVLVTPLLDDMVKDVTATMYVLLGAVGLLLLIACGNVANLLLARASARSREIAVRSALGAGRFRIIRQLLTESLLLSLLAGALGIMLAYAGSGSLVALAPANVPRLADVRIDLPVLAFAIGLSVISCIFFGLAPAVRAARAESTESLKLRGSAGGDHSWLRRALVVAEIALAVVLLAGAGLLMRSFSALQRVSLGFKPENVLVMETNIPAASLESARLATNRYQSFLTEAANLPGVRAVGAVRSLPGSFSSIGVYLVDQTADLNKVNVNDPQAISSVVTPGAFEALSIPFVSGRDFDARDSYEGPPTAVINEAMAKAVFHGQDPIGHTIVSFFDSANPPPMKIVGVVGDLRERGPTRNPEPEIFMPYRQHPRPSTALKVVIRTSLPPLELAAAFRQKAREIVPDMSVEFTTMEAKVSEGVAAPRFRTMLLGLFAAIAFGLAMAGVFGIVSFTVAQRTREIALRLALGASPFAVLKMILLQGFGLAAAGLVLGLAGAFAAARLASSLLFGVTPTDTGTYLAVGVAVILVTASATFIPARQAARIQPMVALRQE